MFELGKVDNGVVFVPGEEDWVFVIVVFVLLRVRGVGLLVCRR